MVGLGRTSRLVLPLMLVGETPSLETEDLETEDRRQDEGGFARIMGYDAHRATLQGCAAGRNLAFRLLSSSLLSIRWL
jgi:hypothetical protein